MNRDNVTPEEFVLGVPYPEIMEMLAELGMDASYDTAMRLKQLVRMFRNFEKAIEILEGPTRTASISPARLNVA